MKLKLIFFEFVKVIFYRITNYIVSKHFGLVLSYMRNEGTLIILKILVTAFAAKFIVKSISNLRISKTR